MYNYKNIQFNIINTHNKRIVKLLIFDMYIIEAISKIKRVIMK